MLPESYSPITVSSRIRPPFVHEMFSSIAEGHADLIALEIGDKRITYGHLHRRSDAMAQLLRAAGAGPGGRVVVFAEDREFLVVALLAILKAGAVFVPLLPETPARRAESMLELCGPGWGLVQPEYLEQFRHMRLSSPVHVIAEAPDLVESGSPTSVEPVESDPDALCYIFFTSGSTGAPKGIAGRLKAIDHYIRWEMGALGLKEGTRVSQFISPMFDAFLRDIFLPLCLKGTICVPADPQTMMDGTRLRQWINERKVNLIHTVPSVFRLLLSKAAGQERMDSLGHVLLSGEPLLPGDVRKWYALGEAARLVNLYGASETTMTKFIYFVSPQDADRASVPVGKPIEGAQAAIIDENGNLCRPGMVGEIFIRTPYRSLGYYNRPDLTSAAFIPNRFSKENDPNDLLYRTGDLARILDSGDYELVGRRDQQVKVRGVRIELTEIEAVLMSCPGVEQAAAVVHGTEEGSNYLCAYVVPGEGCEIGALRQHVLNFLPESMAPSAYVALARLPRTLNGKVDRRALLPPKSMLQGTASSANSLLSMEEEVLCGIFEEVLGQSPMGRDDNFFDLGGHSLLVTQVMSRVRGALGLEIPLRTLFEAPTARELSEKIRDARRSATKAPPPLVRVQRGAESPLSFAQQRLWVIHQLHPQSAAYNITSALRLHGRLDKPALFYAIREIVDRHESLRTRFRENNGVPVQELVNGAVVPVEEIDLAGLNEDVLRLVHAWAEEPFDLQNYPLLRVKLLGLGAEEHMLVITMHHIVSDGWSIGVLVHELAELYGARVKGEKAKLKELDIGARRWREWNRWNCPVTGHGRDSRAMRVGGRNLLWTGR
ncbi:MAG: amino acid adenylation domain-containing protein [Acidobacteriia bacterium]|nr:amino acid adenylation domain-containing protein [Terriglobia bacterium]